MQYRFLITIGICVKCRKFNPRKKTGLFSYLKYYLLIFAVTTGFGTSTHAQTFSYKELQAAYIFNFAKYIKWPAASNAFVIGVYRESENVAILTKALAGKTVRGKTIEIKLLESTDDLSGINIIYLPESVSRYIKEVVTAVDGKSILLVSEEDLIKKGAAISFVVEEDLLKFKLKKVVFDGTGLVAMDGLLKLAILE